MSALVLWICWWWRRWRPLSVLMGFASHGQTQWPQHNCTNQQWNLSSFVFGIGKVCEIHHNTFDLIINVLVFIFSLLIGNKCIARNWCECWNASRAIAFRSLGAVLAESYRGIWNWWIEGEDYWCIKSSERLVFSRKLQLDAVRRDEAEEE